MYVMRNQTVVMHAGTLSQRRSEYACSLVLLPETDAVTHVLHVKVSSCPLSSAHRPVFLGVRLT